MLGPDGGTGGRGPGGVRRGGTPAYARLGLGGGTGGGPPPEHTVTMPEAGPSRGRRAPSMARPGFGTVGKKKRIKANLFLVTLSDRDFHHYDVSVTPEVTSPRAKREIMKELIWFEGKTTISGLQIAYDGNKNLYTAGPLPFQSKEFVVKFVEGDQTRGKIRPYKVRIKFLSRIELNHLRGFLSGEASDAPPHETIRLLDAVLRESPSNNFNVDGPSFFTPGLDSPIDIGKGVECWKGFYQSLRPTQMGMALNIDVTAAPFYGTNILVHEFVKDYLNCWDSSVPGSVSPLSTSDCSKLNEVLRGLKVKATHGEKRTYTVIQISEQPTNKLMFHKDGSEKSIVAYFKERYGIMLKYDSWPSIQCGTVTKPVYLPMEVCQIIEGQRYVKKLNDRQVIALLREASEEPSVMEKKTQRIAMLNCYEEGSLEHEFGIDVKKEFIYIDARVLPAPTLQYHYSGKRRAIRPQLGRWKMKDVRMFHGATVTFWRCMNFSSLPEHVASEFCRHLVEMCRDKGMDITPTPMAPLLSIAPNEIENALVDAHMSSGEGKPLQLLIIILPNISGFYGRIKRKCETELGIITQCCQLEQAEKCNPQYLQDVALKINIKTGGINTLLRDNLPLKPDGSTIIFGASVSHPQPGEDYGASIAAVVASMNMTWYKALVSAQPRGQEMVAGDVSREMIRKLLKPLGTLNYQKRIIFFRDAVSEGQCSEVLRHELDCIRMACLSLNLGHVPVTYVAVQKRHHTHFFPTNPSKGSINILPGTVVDSKICHPRGFDFYLYSHADIKGTSRPTHYHVLVDENKFSPNALQTLTNNLCYTYAMCTSSVSEVPPVCYARLAAARARCYMEGDCGASDAEPDIGVMKEAAPVRPLPSLCPNIKNSMFFC